MGDQADYLIEQGMEAEYGIYENYEHYVDSPLNGVKMPIEKWSNEYMHELTKKLIKESIVTCCVNCDNFNEATEMCNLHPSTRPPARVIAGGCPEWYQKLPF